MPVFRTAIFLIAEKQEQIWPERGGKRGRKTEKRNAEFFDEKNKKYLKNMLDKSRVSGIINPALASDARAANEIAGLCKGSTTDSDSVCEGSNPSPAAKTKP